MSQLYRRFKVYKCIDWENTLERTYSDWLESNVHFPGNRDILVMNKTIAMMNKSYFIFYQYKNFWSKSYFLAKKCFRLKNIIYIYF